MTIESTGRKTIGIDDREVSLQAFIEVAEGGVSVALSARPVWRRRVRRGRGLLEDALRAGETVHGVSTGVGNNSSRAVDTAAQIEFAMSVMEQHGCGVGEPLSPVQGRAVVLARLISLSKGLSAVRFGLLESLCALLNHDIVPVIPRWGSVGASGDLTPLSYVAAVLAGRRKAYYRGRRMDAAKALATELIALSNAARLRDQSRFSTAARRLLAQVRAASPVLAVRDRPLDADIERVTAWLETSEAAR